MGRMAKVRARRNRCSQSDSHCYWGCRHRGIGLAGWDWGLRFTLGWHEDSVVSVARFPDGIISVISPAVPASYTDPSTWSYLVPNSRLPRAPAA